eukprot:5782900-Prymnesium_polylepis.1
MRSSQSAGHAKFCHPGVNTAHAFSLTERRGAPCPPSARSGDSHLTPRAYAVRRGTAPSCCHTLRGPCSDSF